MKMVPAGVHTGLPAWVGYIRSGSGFPPGPRREQGRLEMGAAAFCLPDAFPPNPASQALSKEQFCVFSGHLFNRADLVRQLGLPVERTEPDGASAAAAVLEGYRRWGLDLLARLEGVFALAVWDGAQQTLLCARDPIGLHPFFYSQVGAGLVFSWDAETVRRHPLVSRDLNRVEVAEDLMHRWMSSEETHFAGVRRLPGGHGLKFCKGELTTFCYWQPLPPGRPIDWVTAEELTGFPDLLRSSVERTMQFGPVGIFLSGGFDSISVAATARDIAAARGWDAPHAFCAGFPGEHSEDAVQRKVAELLGLPQTFRYAKDYAAGGELLGSLLDQSAHYPWPPMNVFSPIYSDLQRAARSQGCAAVLTGEGGDEWLTVTPLYAADLIRTGNGMELARLIRTVLRCWHLPWLPAVRNVLWTCGLRPVARDWLLRRTPRLALRRRRWLADRALPRWLAPDPILRKELLERFYRWEVSTCPDSFYAAAMREAYAHPMMPVVFEESFYRDALAGIPAFHPYWNHKLIEFLLRTPPALLNSGGRSKALVRQALHRRFPQLGFEKQKKTTVSRFNAEVYRREGPPIWERLGRARMLTELGVVDARLFHDVLQSCQESDKLVDLHRIWHSANLEAWARSHL